MSTFETYRRLLFSIAYRMLGSVMEAEDIVQETYLRWVSQKSDIENPKAYLCQITTRLCLDHLKSAATRREEYVGPWLPEPLVNYDNTHEETLMLSDSLSFAFLILLEQLSPDERAVFILRQVYDYEYETIGLIIGKSESNCRQLLSRAKKRIQVEAPEPSEEIKLNVISQLTLNLMQGNVDGMMQLLHPDVVAWSDGGGKTTAARRPVRGAKNVAAFFSGLWRQQPDGFSIQPATINNQPGIVMTVHGTVYGTIAWHIVDDKVKGIFSVLNPDKLQHIEIGS